MTRAGAGSKTNECGRRTQRDFLLFLCFFGVIEEEGIGRNLRDRGERKKCSELKKIRGQRPLPLVVAVEEVKALESSLVSIRISLTAPNTTRTAAQEKARWYC